MPARPRAGRRRSASHHGSDGVRISTSGFFSAGSAGGFAASPPERFNLMLNLSDCEPPLPRDQSDPLIIRSCGSKPSFLSEIVCVPAGSTSLLEKGVTPAGTPSIVTSAPDGLDVIL